MYSTVICSQKLQNTEFLGKETLPKVKYYESVPMKVTSRNGVISQLKKKKEMRCQHDFIQKMREKMLINITGRIRGTH